MKRCISTLLFAPAVAFALFATTLAAVPARAAAAQDEPTTTTNATDEDVTITTGETRTVYEYRQNGALRMIRIVPKFGRPYYLVPADPTRGGGDLEQKGQLVPSWRIVEF